MEVRKASTSAGKKHVPSFKRLSVITPTPWGFAAHPACQPPGTLWQARACTPTWGWRVSLLPGNTDRSLPSHRSRDGAVSDLCGLTWQWGGGTSECSQFWSQAWPGRTSLPGHTPGWTPHIYNKHTQQSTLPLNPLEMKLLLLKSL